MPHLSRRKLLHSSLAAGLLLPQRLWSQPQPSGEARWLLIGTGQKGIYRARWNAITGEIGPAELAIATPQPSFLARHPHLPVLYACNELDAPAAAVTAFTLDPLRALLTPLNSQPTHGSAPCFVSLDRSARLLFAANYNGGSLSVFPLDNAGKPHPAATVFTCKGNTACGNGGPMKDRQSAPHLHCATLSPEGRFVLACDLGDDAIMAFPIEAQPTDPLGVPVRIATAAGAGPRHLAFHPNGQWLYCINEIDCTVTLYHWLPHGNQAAAEVVPEATVSIRPANSAGKQASTAAEIAISSDGRFLYTSTRFSDVLTVFFIAPSHGGLTLVQQLSCGGKTPRFFGLDPKQQWLLCANQDNDTITVFSRDPQSGRLTPKSTHAAPNPQCIVFV